MQHSVLECVPLFLFAPFHPARSAHLNASNALVRLTKTFCNYRVAHCSWFSQFFSIFGFCAPKNMEKWREREIERGMEREKETPIGQCDRWLFIIIFIFCFVCSEISWNAWRTQWILASLMGGDDDLVGDIMSASIVQKGPTHLLCFSLSIHLLFIQMQFFFFFFYLWPSLVGACCHLPDFFRHFNRPMHKCPFCSLTPRKRYCSIIVSM